MCNHGNVVLVPVVLMVGYYRNYNCFLIQEIRLGEADVVLTGGTESMTQAPYTLRNIRWGTTLGQDLKV